MLKSLPVSLRAAAFALLAVVFHACTPQRDEVPTPDASPTLTVRDAQTWYQSTYPTAALLSGPQPNTTSTAAKGSAPAAPVLVWAHALTLGQGSQQLVLVPMAGDQALFAARRWQGTRYLIVARNAAQALNGNVLELLLRRTSTPVDTLALFSNLYRGFVSGRPTAPAIGEGLVLLYSADYHYLTGRQFRNGQLLPGASRLVFLPYHGNGGNKSNGPSPGTSTQSRTTSGACTDWYDGTTGAYITTTGDCGLYVDNGSYDPNLIDYGNSGTPADILSGPNGYGGSGGGGVATPTLSPNVVLVIPPPPNHTIQNVPDHLKCFNKAQGATFSVYATQPRPGTRATWTGSPLRPDVGHTFISITQGGITRVVGFYPAGGVTPLNPSGPSTLADDSDHDYSVRIDMPLTAAQLESLLNYILAYPGTYNLNSYNCTDFGVGAAGAAGLSLPTTQGSWAPGSGGLNPGDLGQDMRTMSLPAGVSRDVQSGQADSDNGSC